MGIAKKVVVADGISARTQLFTPEECLVITDYAIRYGQVQPGLVHAHLEASETPLRRCKEYIIDPHKIDFPDGSSVASRVYEAFALANVWDLEYSEVPSIRVMEYQKRDGYGAHTDWSNGAAKNRKLSMTCQLTRESGYEGGEVVLYAGPEDETISRVQGMATVWPSWTLHEVKPVTAGVRYALTAWAHGNPYR